MNDKTLAQENYKAKYEQLHNDYITVLETKYNLEERLKESEKQIIVLQAKIEAYEFCIREGR